MVSQIYWPAPGGAAVVLRQLSRAWARAGHAVTALSTRSDPAFPPEQQDGEVSIVRLPSRSGRLVATADYLWRTVRWVRRHGRRFDAICVSMLKHGALATLVARPG